MRRLTILSVAYPFASVGPDAVGGAEQVLWALDRAIVAAGHRSIVVACEGSHVAGELAPLPSPRGALTPALRDAVQRRVAALLAELQGRADVVHLHGVDFAAYLPPPGAPALATLHLAPEWYPAEALRPARPMTWLHGVSRTQDAALRAALGGAAGHVLPPIGNGVPVAALGAARHARRGFALTLGRICPEKGQHLALEAAHRADMPLLIAGAVFDYPEHRAYWRQRVQPLLDARRRWIGPVGFARKRRLLSAARCVLVPSLVAETSSLVAMEAAACGTPVIALPSGALCETVEDGRTGFLVPDARAMAAAMRRSGAISAAVCRAVAAERFSVERCTAAYLARYAALAARVVARC